MTELSGEIIIAAPLERVRAALNDAALLLGCVNDVERVVHARPDSAAWEVRPDFGISVGTVAVTLDLVPGDGRTRYAVTANGAGASAEASGSAEAVELAPGQTRLTWAVTLDRVGGLLKIIPKSLLLSNARREIAAIVGRLAEKLSGA